MTFSSQLCSDRTETLLLSSLKGKRIDRMVLMYCFILQVDVADDWLTVVVFDCASEVIKVCLCLLHCGASSCPDEDC